MVRVSGPQSSFSSSAAEEEQHRQDEEPQQYVEEGAPSHHPSAPPEELLDISTTVDPVYVISLIRKLIPSNARSESGGREDKVSTRGEELPAESGGVEIWEESGCILWDLAVSKVMRS